MFASKLPFPLNFVEESNQITLENGSILLDSADLTALVQSDNFIQTWPSANWLLIGITTDEKIAVFEADDSWLLAILNLETGEWFSDDDPIFIHYSLEEDQEGDFVLEHRTGRQLRLK